MLVIVLTALLLAYAHGDIRTCYGDIDRLNPTGRSSGGVSASNQEANADLVDLNRYRNCIQATADRNCIQASVIAAIASRESRGGRLLTSDGYDRARTAFGIMQCDLRTSGLPCTSCQGDICCHVEMMVSRKLIPYINQIKRKLPSWTQDQALQGGVAAYNAGPRNVQTWGGIDNNRGTTRDYSNDVMARAKELFRLGWN